MVTVENKKNINLKAENLYLNRELTWLAFNGRVLDEAQDPRTPLLERLKFIAIVSNNLDEFFMKRIGGLKQQVGAHITELTVDGRSAQQQINECYDVVRKMENDKAEILDDILLLLEKQGIKIFDYQALNSKSKRHVRDNYIKNIYPLMTPQAMDPAHPFPFISNLSFNLLLTLHYPEQTETSLARVKIVVGEGSPRFIRISDDYHFVSLEEVVANNLDLLFPEMSIDCCEYFRVTRNAVTEQNDEQADDLLSMIELELRNRTFASIVRLEVSQGMDPVHHGMLAAELGLDEGIDVFENKSLLAMSDLFQLASLPVAELRDSAHHPANHPKLLDNRNIFHQIRDNGSILLQHPYESFTSTVEAFIKESSTDAKVRSIKMTLYRTSQQSDIIKYLINAARNGKRVVVVVELQARFDEAANIRWANSLEREGIHVTYGILGLKIHSKTTLVVRQDYNGIKSYAHIGTGNYHAVTARLYTDIGLLTCDAEIVHDLTEFFNYLTTGYTPSRQYKKILPSPKILKRSLLQKISREAKHHKAFNNGLIQFKMNALEDVDITEALYKAAIAGVRIDLIVRDTCRIRPGLKGISEQVNVICVIGRFLEHARIYYFHNNHEEEYYIGSADCMKRNLESRVEVVAPITGEEHCHQLRLILDGQLSDKRSGWRMLSDGTYERLQENKNNNKNSQQIQIDAAEEREKSSARLRNKKIRNRKRTVKEKP